MASKSKEKGLSWQEVTQNVAIEALWTGWPAVFVVPLLLLAVFYCVPNDEKVPLLEKLLQNYWISIGGYVLSLLMIGLWLFHVRWIKREFYFANKELRERCDSLNARLVEYDKQTSAKLPETSGVTPSKRSSGS
jgi:hypothetical protein